MLINFRWKILINFNNIDEYLVTTRGYGLSIEDYSNFELIVEAYNNR